MIVYDTSIAPEMNQKYIDQLTKILEANYADENFGPEQLAEKLGLSHSTLHRRLKDKSGKTISQFIREVRLNKAEELLQDEEITVAEVAYRVGFASTTYFSKCFHDYFGTSPGDYRHKMVFEKNAEALPLIKKRKTALIALTVIILITVILIIYAYDNQSKTKNTNKSVAIFPVEYIGEPGYKYQALGFGEEIKNKLSTLEDLRVLDISIIEDSLFANRTEKQKMKELDVGFLQKSSIQKTNDGFLLFVKLTNAKNGELIYNQKYTVLEKDRLSTPNAIAEAIANQLHAQISSEEKIRMQKVPTLAPEAKDFYELGRAAHMNYWQNEQNLEALQRAENYYRKALNIDSTFARAYAGLARIAYDKTTWSDIFKTNFLDTVLTLANQALSFDNTLPEAYTLRGDIFRERGTGEAISEYEKALEYDPNNWQAYNGLGNYYLLKDNVKSAANFLEAAKRRRGPEYKLMLDNLIFIFVLNGLFDEGQEFMSRKLMWDDDSIYYYRRLAHIEEYKEHFNQAIEYASKAWLIDSTNLNVNALLAFNYVLLKNYQNALPYYERITRICNRMNFKLNNEHHRMGYIYLMTGDSVQANEYFRRQIDADLQLIELGNADRALYDLAATYAVLNEKEKAYETLEIFEKQKAVPWFFYFYLKNDPLFNGMRNEADFQQILNKVKGKAGYEREKLIAWVNQQESI